MIREDIWGTADQFYFNFNVDNGDVEFQVFVEDFICDHEWGKGGIMIRDGLAPDSAYFALFVTGSNGLAKQWRACNGCDTSAEGDASVYGRWAWFKVTKIGNIFQAYFKTDDSSDWVALGSPETMNFSDVIYVGVAVTSHDNSKTADLLWSYNGSKVLTTDVKFIKLSLPKIEGASNPTLFIQCFHHLYLTTPLHCIQH